MNSLHYRPSVEILPVRSGPKLSLFQSHKVNVLISRSKMNNQMQKWIIKRQNEKADTKIDN